VSVQALLPHRRAPATATARVRLLVLVLATAAAGTSAVGCAAPMQALDQRAALVTGSGSFELRFAEVDREAQRAVQRAMEAAAPGLARWGGLVVPVTVQVLPSHDALEHAVRRPGYGWLKAWARYEEVFVQSPRTWSLLGVRQRDLDELMLHELTHCVMYQRAADRDGWQRKRIPLWFREGMASHTAEQAYRWPTLEDLARFYASRPDADPVMHPEPLYQGESDIVYGAAHHAFGFLVRRYGEETVRTLLASMREGRTFPDAFEAVLGLSQEAFEREFRRYVTLGGFRSGRLRLRPGQRRPAMPAPPAAPPPIPSSTGPAPVTELAPPAAAARPTHQG
jgi:hypothetical protein